MKILVDADACPVKDIIVRVAKKFDIEVFMFADTNHILNDNYSTIITVDQGKDSVDIKLVNNIQKGDIVITQDYGVATVALSKHAYALNQNGLIYDNDNMDRLLFERFLSQKIRKSGRKMKGNKKRNNSDNQNFEKALTNICIKAAVFL